MTDRRGRGRHRGPFEGEPFGRDPRRGGRMRRGDIRTALLAALREAPGHGYDVMQALEAKSGGTWRPSAGSVYPTLQLLEDEGLVRSSERDGKRVYEITDAGRNEVERRIDDAGGLPWELAGRGGNHQIELRQALAQLVPAFKQVAVTGTPAQAEQAVEILRDARRKLYQLLAED
jgi:DNA-binding PadR family transcriptional regulator